MFIWVYLLSTCASLGALPDKSLLQTDAVQLKDSKVLAKGYDITCMAFIAQKAAVEAKAAQMAQMSAASQAAHNIKSYLAKKAVLAAKGARLALFCKQSVVTLLQCDVQSAISLVKQNVATVSQHQSTLSTAKQVAAQATALHKLMCEATNLAQQLEKTALYLLEKAKAGLLEKCQHLADARARLAYLQHKLQCACEECAAIQQATYCACQAARAACENIRKRRNIGDKTVLAQNKCTLEPKV